MSYDMAGNPNTIYVPVDTSSSGFAIVAVFSVFLFLAVWNGLKFWGRVRALRASYPGFAMDAKTRSKGLFALGCLVASVACVGLYALNPNYAAEQEAQANVAIEAIADRFGLDARWELSPYNPLDGEDRLGKIFIQADGQDYPTRITAATYQGRSDGEEVTRKSDATFVVEVQTSSGYVPISDFAKQHDLSPRY